MDYGKAFHKFLHSYYAGESPEIALNKAIDYYTPICKSVPDWDFRDLGHLYQSILCYIKKYPQNLDSIKPFNKDNLEITFTEPFHIYNDCVEVVLVGTIDFLGTFLGVEKVFVDHKTTSMSREDQRKQFFESFWLDIQPKFYSFNIRRKMKLDFWMPFIANGIFIKPSTKKAAKSLEFDGCILERSPDIVNFSDEIMMEFEEWLNHRIEFLVRCAIKGEWLPNFTCCRDNYGLCQFFNSCKIRKEYRKQYLEANFSKRQFNPLTYSD
jgi:hypothetical protein